MTLLSSCSRRAAALWLCALLSASALPAAAQQPDADSGAAAAERALSLDESLHLALLNDAQFLSAEQDIQIAEQRVREARFLFYPEMGVEVNGTEFSSERPFVLSPDFGSLFIEHTPGQRDQLLSGRAYFIEDIYNGGRTTNTLELAQAGLKQANARYDGARLDVSLQVKKVFYQYLFAQEKGRLLAERLKDAETASESASLTAWERLETETLLETLRAEDSASRHDLEEARLQFLKALNLELDTPVHLDGRLETRPVTVDPAKLSVWAIELRPELQSEVYRAQMDAIGVNLALSRRLPSIFVGADYEYTANEFPLNQNNWDATLGIRIPITYDFITELRQKKAEQRQGQIKRAELQDEVQLQVQEAYQTLSYWQAEWQRRLSAVDKSRGLLTQADKTAGPLLTKAHALKGLTDMEISLLESVKEHLLSKAQLERAVGRSLD